MQAALGVNTLTVLANIKTLLGQTCTKMIKLVGVVVGEGLGVRGEVDRVSEKIFVAAVGSGDGGKGPGFDVVRGVG